jgi:hypothetical protein
MEAGNRETIPTSEFVCAQLVARVNEDGGLDRGIRAAVSIGDKLPRPATST